LRLHLAPQEITLVSFAILASQRQRAVVAITWITDLYIRTITKTTATDTVLDILEIAIGTRNYVQQLMKMIAIAYEVGIDEQRLTAWCTLFRMRYDLRSSIDIGGIAAAALAIDGKNLADGMNHSALMQKAGLIALINSRNWNHQAVLDILDNVRTPTNCFLCPFVDIPFIASRSLFSRSCHTEQCMYTNNCFLGPFFDIQFLASR
jgi:hypothetical protein